MKKPSFVLLHGAWAGSWVWDGIRPALEGAGYGVVTPDLPGGGPWRDDADLTLDDMVNHVIASLPPESAPWILVGHSGGGIVGTTAADRLQAKDPRCVAGLVFLAGMMLPSGMAFPEACRRAGLSSPVGIETFLRPTEDGRGTVVPPEAACAVFFHEADPADAVAAAGRLRPQMNSTWRIAPSWSEAHLATVPRLYIEALADRSVPLAAQREMQALVPGAERQSLDTDHAPQLSARQAVIGLLLAYAARLAKREAASAG